MYATTTPTRKELLRLQTTSSGYQGPRIANIVTGQKKEYIYMCLTHIVAQWFKESLVSNRPLESVGNFGIGY
uniref:Kinesin motor domain-containing protein n=1 Tax=Syphacia muris TaxID=451379 RepID=A0A0N5AD44_9BILA